MMNPAITERIALIIPRLGSNHDGEVVAAAKAIERILSTEKLDWRTIAGIVANSSQHLSEEPIHSWHDMPQQWRAQLLSTLLCLPGLSEWEGQFLRSVAQKFHQGFALSAKQIDIIDRLAQRSTTQEAA